MYYCTHCGAEISDPDGYAHGLCRACYDDLRSMGLLEDYLDLLETADDADLIRRTLGDYARQQMEGDQCDL